MYLPSMKNIKSSPVDFLPEYEDDDVGKRRKYKKAKLVNKIRAKKKT